jgi:hypothetical protein
MFQWQDNPDGSVSMILTNGSGKQAQFQWTAGSLPQLVVTTPFGKHVIIAPNDTTPPAP